MARNISKFIMDDDGSFSSDTGEEIIKEKIKQVLLTQKGELAWDPSFGSNLNKVRHQKNTRVISELARVYIEEAIEQHIPEVQIIDTVAQRGDSSIVISIIYAIGDDGDQQSLSFQFGV